MLQSLVDADAFGRVQHQGAVQQVLQLHHLLPLVLGQALAPDHVGQQIFGGVDGAHNRHLFLKTQESKPVLVSEKPTFFLVVSYLKEQFRKLTLSVTLSTSMYRKLRF